MTMPMNLLRHLDITNGEEEKMVQRVLNTRLKDMPIPANFNFPASMTDNMTIEKERALQAKIDAYKAKVKAGIIVDEDEEGEEPAETPEEETPLIPETEEEDVPPLDTPPLPDPTAPVEPLDATAVTKFCDYCDSKRKYAHKIGCTRPSKVV